MAKLHDIPTEIIFQILRHLRHSKAETCDKPTRDLCNAARVSQKLKTLVQTTLYQHVCFSDEQSAWRVRPFFRTIAHHPALASQVETLNIVGWRAHPSPESPCRSDVRLFHKLLDSLGLTDFSFWQMAAKQMPEELYVAFTLILLPNLRELDLWTPIQRMWLVKVIDYASVLRSRQGSNLGFRKLERVRLGMQRSYTHTHVHYMEPFFHLPFLTKLEIYGDAWIGGWPQTFHRKSSLKQVTLLDNTFEFEDLSGMLSSIKSLQSLHFQPRSKEAVMYAWQIGDAISLAAASLTDLRLDTKFHWTQIFQHQNSMLHFATLQRLQMNQAFFAGTIENIPLVEILPPSLQELLMPFFNLEASIDFIRNFMLRLSEYVDAKPVHMLGIRKIGTWHGTTAVIPHYSGLPEFASLIASCEEANVVFEGTLPFSEDGALLDLRFGD